MRAALLVVLLAALARADDAPPPKGPAARLEVPERTFDAGKVNHGFPVKHSFVLKNVGDAELKIDAKPG